VAWLHNNDAVQQLNENVVLCNLAQIRVNNAVLSRIPNNIGGVYPLNNNDQDYEYSELTSDKLIEDILSRLFLPSFTLRYG
jgi:hypothetical protein